MSLDWIPGVVVAVGGSILAFWKASAVSEATLEAKVKALGQSSVDMTAELRAAVSDLRQIVVEFKTMSAAQAVVNKVTSAALDSIVSKLELHDRTLSDHGATLTLMRELMMKQHQ